MTETEAHIPTAQELESTRLFFIELQDALTHYSFPVKMALHTLTVRSNQDGNPQVELVSETRFPVLDDISDHFKRLHIVAEKLDQLPAEFWEVNNGYLGGQFPEALNYIPMQVFLWGQENSPERKTQLQEHFKQFGWNVKGAFTRNVHGYDLMLSELSWANAKGVYGCKDDAEQSFRIMDAYIQLKEYFDKRGLPEGVEDF